MVLIGIMFEIYTMNLIILSELLQKLFTFKKKEKIVLMLLQTNRLEFLLWPTPKKQFLWYTVKEIISLIWRKFC